MSKFNKNDKITRSSGDAKWARIGFKAVVLDDNMYLDALGEVNEIIDDYWELATPKWTIYNNTLPWSDLNDKQKCKMLLAGYEKIKFTCNKLDVYGPLAFNNKSGIYQSVKPASTMAELFVADIAGCTWNDLAPTVIAKGWVKL